MWVSREMDEKKNVKICFAASSGGHYEQLMMLKPLMEKYDSFVITEKTDYSAEAKGEKTYYMKQVNRREKDFIWRMIQNAWKSIGIYRKEKPDVVICTGVLAMIPICLISKFMGKKLIYIESFAKVTSPTETGKLLYKFADQFYVQWKPMLKFYPNTLFGSGAMYSCGEDTLFLKELIEKGLKLYKSPIRIASVDMSDSTWFKGYNEKYFKDKGALIEAAYPRISGLLAILQSVRNSKKCMGSYKYAAKIFSYYISGIADYRKVISEGDVAEGENIKK